MPYRSLCGMALLLVLAPGCGLVSGGAAPTTEPHASSGPAVDRCENAYQPVATGATWAYRTSSASGERAATETITGVGLEGYTLRSQSPSGGGSSEWRCTPQGLVALGYAAAPGLLVRAKTTSGVTVPPDIAPGDAWAQRYRVAGRQLTVTYRASGEERVRVPAGAFDAVRVVSETRPQGWSSPSLVTTAWFAEGVGLIKAVTSGVLRGADVSGTTVLTSYAL